MSNTATVLLGGDWTTWLYRACVLLIIACPCALVISTPVSIVAGLTALARRGVLVKGGAHLEAVGRLRALAVDKTGTITEGRPQTPSRPNPLKVQFPSSHGTGTAPAGRRVVGQVG